MFSFDRIVDGQRIFEVGLDQCFNLVGRYDDYGWLKFARDHQRPYLVLATTQYRYGDFGDITVVYNAANLEGALSFILGVEAARRDYRFERVYEIWHIFGDDAELWGDWDEMIALRSAPPKCVVCGDSEYGPWVRVSVKAGGWRYLCEDCYDTFNRVNSLVGRARLKTC